MSMDGAMQSPNVRGGMLLPVGDKAKLDALLARIGEKSGIAPRHEGGVSVIALGEDSSVSGLCAYNDVAVMLYFAQGRRKAQSMPLRNSLPRSAARA